MLSSSTLTLILTTLAVFLLIHISLRFFHRRAPHLPPRRRPRTSPAHLLTVLGSGGHTAEMLSMLSTLDPQRYTHRTWIMSTGDSLSRTWATEFEATLQQRWKSSAPALNLDKEEVGALNGGATTARVDGEGIEHVERKKVRGQGRGNEMNGVGEYRIYTLPRAREIHQSLFSTPWSCLRCLYACVRLLWLLDSQSRSGGGGGAPDLVVTNGPATALVVLLAVRMLRPALRLLRWWGRHGGEDSPRSVNGQMKTIYVESWARVKTPSLSLRIIGWVGLCDRVIVQHRYLEEKGWGEWRWDLMR